MTVFVAARNTCFALISAIEDDFRSLIATKAEALMLLSDILPTDVRAIAFQRRASDQLMNATTAGTNDIDLLPYIDFADISKIIVAKLAPKLDAEREWLLNSSKLLLKLTPVRNRVCHTRPLESEDFVHTYDFAKTFLEPCTPFSFPVLSGAMARLQANPAYVLSLQVPSFWAAGNPKIPNNLPVPEFDETGFLGRSADRSQVAKLLQSRYPVVTIVGEGGIGKTALALRCLYDLLDAHETEYDAVVWISLKTAALSQAGVRDLSGAIKTTLGLLTTIASQLGAPDTNKLSEVELIEEVSQYLEVYRVVIAIDNLETISTGALRGLLERIPASSKILLTSRVGVGEFEVRYALKGLDEKTSIALFRTYSRVLSVQELFQSKDENIKGYCHNLFNNPLLIKWFVESVGRGAEPAQLLRAEGSDFSTALSFCFENLFERFSEKEKVVIDCLASARQPLSKAEIHFVAPQLTNLDTEIALSALHNSSVVSRQQAVSGSLEYSVSESAITFLNTKAPPTSDFFKNVQSRLRQLRTITTQEAIKEARHEYDPHFVRIGNNRDDKISATHLRTALDALKENKSDEARNAIAEAIQLTPDSSEAWRIGALIEQRAQQYYRAAENYERAIGLSPQSRIAKYCFGMFLLTDMDDPEGALAQFNELEKLDPTATPVLAEKAKSLARLDRLEEAAAIHELLLPSIDNSMRLVEADQAANCYRRLALTACAKKDFEQAKSHAKRAFSILVNEAERSDIDKRLLLLVAKVIDAVLSKRELSMDAIFVEYIVSSAEKIFESSHGGSIPITQFAEGILQHLDASGSFRRRLLALDRWKNNHSLIAASAPKITSRYERPAIEGRLQGKIINLGTGGRFGFIEDSVGSRWFFHLKSFREDTDRNKCAVGIPVTFCMGQNAKGPCAVDVEVVSFV